MRILRQPLFNRILALLWLLAAGGVLSPAYAGVKVGDNPTTIGASSLLELESTDKALLISRVANTTAITTPANGMMVYDLSTECFKSYENNAWSRCWTEPAAGAITALSCSTTTSSGTMTSGSAASGVSDSVPYTGGNGGTHSGQTVSSTGVTGLTATLAAGSFATGAGSLTYTITGTPASSGTASFALNIGGQSCTLTRSVVAAFNPASIPDATTGKLAGQLCFDIAESNNNVGTCGLLTGRTAGRANFNLTSTNTQTYTFTPSSAVSNVRFYFVNTNGQVIQSISGDNNSNNITTAQTATVVYNTALSSPTPDTPTSALALGTTSANPRTADIYVVFNNNGTNTGTDQKIKLTATIKDCACCGAMVSPTQWKEFLCHNLGANITLDPNVPAVGLQGGYVQYGKRGPNTTGDSRIDWQTAANTPEFAAAPTATNPNEGDYYGWGWNSVSSAMYAWRTSGGAKTATDPCPTGYRVPTYDEMQGVKNNNVLTRSGTWTASPTYGQATNYSFALHIGPNASTKTLTLPAAGWREVANGRLYGRGTYGMYRTSTDIGSTAWAFHFDNSSFSANAGIDNRFGTSIRCIAQ